MYRTTMLGPVSLAGIFFTGALLVGSGCIGPLAVAQDAPAAPPARGAGGGQRGGFAGMQRVSGEVTAVSGATLTLKTEEGGTVQVVTTDNTRVMKGRAGVGGGAPTGGTVKVSDLKVGDGVVASGTLDEPNKTIHAAILIATDAAEVKRLKENLGKTFITGKVTAIDLDNAKMTVERTDKVSQTIGFDETTSFKRGGRGGGMGAMGMGGGAGAAPAAGAAEGGESITLADIKVGDNVTGTGSVKGGTFVPAQLMVTTPRVPGAGGPGGRRRGPGGAGPEGGAPTTTPGTPGTPPAGPGI